MGWVPYYTDVFLEIPHDAAQEKNLDVLVFPLLTNMYCKITAYKKCEMIGIAIVLITLILIVIIAALIIHANNKHSARYFLLLD